MPAPGMLTDREVLQKRWRVAWMRGTACHSYIPPGPPSNQGTVPLPLGRLVLNTNVTQGMLGGVHFPNYWIE